MNMMRNRYYMSQKEKRRRNWIVGILVIILILLLLGLLWLFCFRGKKIIEEEVSNSPTVVLNIGGVELQGSVDSNDTTDECVISKQLFQKIQEQPGVVVAQYAKNKYNIGPIFKDGKKMPENLFVAVKDIPGDVFVIPENYLNILCGISHPTEPPLPLPVEHIPEWRDLSEEVDVLDGVSSQWDNVMKNPLIANYWWVFVGLLLIMYIIAQFFSIRKGLVITVNRFDQIIIIASAICAVINSFANEVNNGQNEVSNLTYTIFFFLVGISIILSIWANFPNPLYILLSIFAKVFLFIATVWIIWLILIIILFSLVISGFSSSNSSHDSGWEVIGYDSSVNAYFGYKKV